MYFEMNIVIGKKKENLVLLEQYLTGAFGKIRKNIEDTIG